MNEDLNTQYRFSV